MKKRKLFSRLVSTLTAFVVCLMILPMVKPDAAKAENRSGNFSSNYSLGSDPAQNMVNIAFAQEGKKGSQLGYNSDWCAWFVADCARLAGQDTIIPEKGRVRDLASAIKGEETSTPQVGDICIFDWNSVSGPYDHVEIVYQVSGSTVYTIGGNSGSTGSYKTNYVKTRNATETGQIQCYIHPYYNGASTPENDDELGIPYPRPQVSSTVWLGKNGITSGNYVKWLQTALNKADNAGLAVDGQFGSGTTTAVKNFQAKYGLTQDGQAGTSTINKLVEIIKGQMNPMNPPSWAWISATDDRTSFAVGEQIHFWMSADETSSPITHYVIGINKGDERIITEECNGDYYVSFDEPGDYSVYVSAYNSAGWADSNIIYFQIVTPTPQGHVMSESEAAGQTIPNGDYWIYSSINQNYALDIPYDEISTQGANIQMWVWDTEVMPTQYDVFTVTYCGNGFYEIRQKGTDLCLDVFDASLDRGTNVQLWTENDTASQQWSITRTDTGYMLQARCNGYCLDVYGGEFEKETNVRVWDQNNSLAQRFLFIPYGESYGRSIDDGVYSIRSAINSDYCIDAAGNAVYSNYKNETNIQLWETAGCDDLFYVEYLSNGFYNISEISTGLSIDVYNSVSESVYMNVNTNIQLYERHNGRSQSWLIKDNGDGTYTLISKLSGYCLDLKDGTCEESQNIAQFIYNYAGAQKWQFVPVLPERISIEANPNKITYEIGEKITPAGIAVREIYSVDTFRDITEDVNYKYDFSKAGKTNVTVSYAIKGNTYKDTFSVTVNGSEVLGDVNSDGKFNISDAVILQKWLLAEPNTKLADWKAADLCEDDKLDIFDMIEMRKLLIQNNSLSAQ